MNEEIENVINLVEAAQKKGTFSLIDAVKGQSNPKDSVDIYLDAEAAYDLKKVNEKLTGIGDPEALAELEAEAARLSEKIMKSKVTFHMRGIDQRETELIEAKIRKYWDTEEDETAFLTEYLCALIAANIVSVEDADGNVDDHVFTSNEIRNIREVMPVESWNKLVQTMQGLTLATGYFKGLTDAGFLQKS